MDLYLIRTPLRRQGDVDLGGPLRVRVRGRRRAYAAFGSEALAREACEHWGIGGEVFVEPWAEAVRHEPADSRPRHLLLFYTREDFDHWLRDPESYPVDERLLPVLARAVGA